MVGSTEIGGGASGMIGFTEIGCGAGSTGTGSIGGDAPDPISKAFADVSNAF